MNESFYQSQIIEHLATNGSISDRNGLHWVTMFIVKLMKVPQYKKIVDGSGFTFIDLMGAYISIIEATMPVPVVVIESGRRQFLPDLVFNAPEVLTSLLHASAKNLKAAGIPLEAPIEEQVPMNLPQFIQRLQQSPNQRRLIINQTFAEYAKFRRRSLEELHGPATFAIDRNRSGLEAPNLGAGCASLIIFGSVLGGGTWIWTLF